MIITNTIFVINFNPISDLKKKFVFSSDDLNQHFNEPTILPIPENAPDDIPRIICQSKNGHSELTITKMSIQLHTRYDNEYQNDWEKCKLYLILKIHAIIELLTRMDCIFGFSGLTTQVLEDSTENNGTKDLIDKFCRTKYSSDIYDFAQKIAIVKDNKYFINYSINNVRTYKNNESLLKPGFLSNELGNNIGIVLDINNRYDYNYNKNFHSDEESIKKILDLTSNHILNLPKLLEKGALNI